MTPSEIPVCSQHDGDVGIVQIDCRFEEGQAVLLHNAHRIDEGKVLVKTSSDMHRRLRLLIDPPDGWSVTLFERVPSGRVWVSRGRSWVVNAHADDDNPAQARQFGIQLAYKDDDGQVIDMLWVDPPIVVRTPVAC